MVESSSIPTICVGEGTTSVFCGLLLALGLDEFEFLRETEATIKYGIRHRDWREVGITYDGPIDDPHLICKTPSGTKTSWLNQWCIAQGQSVAEHHLFRRLMKHGRSPYVMREGAAPLPLAPFHYEYHFDQALVGRYLRSKATGITHLEATVMDVRRHGETGRITALKLQDGSEYEADFFVDCTGFRRALIADALGPRWISYGDRLPVNRAMPFWLAHDPDHEIQPYTLAAAMSSGWMWQIPSGEAWLRLCVLGRVPDT